MDGYNVNLSCYGQTGSGKTRTLFGEYGIFAEFDTLYNYAGQEEHAARNQDEFINSEETIPKEFGLAYKFILSILYRI